MIILGIDPGKKGALALLDTNDRRVIAHDMPDTVPALHAFMVDLPPVAFAVLEQLHAGPKMSGVTVATMFEAYGALKGALMWRDIQTYTVRPHVWKPALNVPADKTAARRRASEFFPGDADQWKRVKDDGRAEASLIAWYGMKWIKA